MSETMKKILAAKRDSRKRLAALPFAEKLALVEKMRDRSLLIGVQPIAKRAKTR